MNRYKDVLSELAHKAGALAEDPVNLAEYLGRLMRDDRVPKEAKLALIGSGLYIWVDGDMIPDPTRVVPGLGYVDDIILTVHGVKCLVSSAPPQVALQLWPGDEASFKRVMFAVQWLDGQLFERARKWIKELLGGWLGRPNRSSQRAG